MKITKGDVLHVANLARLELDHSSIERFSKQLGDILKYVETLNQVNTEDIPPMSHAISLTNAFRDDIERPHLNRDLSLANAPEKEDGCFIVPKVIG